MTADTVDTAALPLANDLHERFAQAVIVWKDQSRAYAHLFPESKQWKQKSIWEHACRLMARPEVAARVAKLREQHLTDHKASIAAILARATAIANADPAALVQRRIGCCRHCYGVGFGYQRTPREYERDIEAYARAMADPKRKGALPPFDDGGVGFNSTREPNPECPECFGEGAGYTVTMDTRDMPPDARLLYAGVKETKDGLEIKMQDQKAWAELACRVTGAFVERRELSGPGGGPIPTVAATIDVNADPIAAAAAYQRFMQGAG